MNIKKFLPGVQRNILLKDYTTLKIGGRAKYFLVIKNKTELIKAIEVAKKYKLPFFVLGGGSNILVSDKGFRGLVIKLQATGYRSQGNKIYAEAGLFLNQLVNIALKNNLTGLEWAVGIPGTIGGAIQGNAGAFGKSMKNITKEVEVFDIKNQLSELRGAPLPAGRVAGGWRPKVKIFKNRDCKFDYRDSIFKHKKNLIIFSAALQLKKGNKKEIKNKIKKNLEKRKETQPLNFPSAGSIFKNPKGFSARELGEEDKSSSSAFAAAWLIEESGLKGKKIGNVKISDIHANFIVNLGNGKAEDVKKLINLIKRKVKKIFGVNLEEEITILS